MSTMRRLCLLLTLVASPLAAQQPATTPVIPLLPGSTRALGMGGAFLLGSTDSDALFYNAAFADRLRGVSASVQWAGKATTQFSMSAGTDWFGGGIGLGLSAVDYYTPVTADTPIMVAQPAQLLRRNDGTTASERMALLVYGRRIKGVRLAATGKLIEQSVEAERNVTAAADVATAVNFSFLSIGLAAQNLGPGIEVGGTNFDLPLRTALNVGTQAAPIGPLDLSGAAEVAWTRHGDVVPAAGLELSYWPVQGRTFYLCAGGHRALEGEKPFSLGAGFAGDKLVLDYAFSPYADGNVHRIGVRWR